LRQFSGSTGDEPASQEQAPNAVHAFQSKLPSWVRRIHWIVQVPKKKKR
jgi:hypothetical protein